MNHSKAHPAFLKRYEDYLNVGSKDGQIGNIDLRPEPGTFAQKINDWDNSHKKQQALLQSLEPQPARIQQKKPDLSHPPAPKIGNYYYQGNPKEFIRFNRTPQITPLPDPIQEVERQRKERLQERLGIVGNNLADLEESWRQQPEEKSGFQSKKPQRQQDFKIQKAIRRHKLAYKNVHQCGLYAVEKNNVAIHRNAEHGSCSCKGVKTCGSVWACPVCRRKILSRRAEQIKKIASHWSNEGNHLYMLTFTVPHNLGDSLARIYGSSNEGIGLAGAMTKFRSWYAFSKKFKGAIDYFGDLRTVEVTWGKNGWHCHIHMLVFCKDLLIAQSDWQQDLLDKWQKACLDAGLKKPDHHGLDIEYIGDREAADFSAYVAKWGAPGEVSSPYAKTAKNGNLTIAELEKCLIDDFYRKFKQISLEKVSNLLSIYYLTMKGQKMMQMGGCKKGFSWREDLIEAIEATDQELIEDETEEYPGEDLAEIHPEAFHQIAERGLVFRLLDFAESDGYQGILDFMESQGLLYAVYRPQSIKYVMKRTQNLNWPELTPG